MGRRRKHSGGGCGLAVMLLIIAFLGLMLTKPDEAAHRRAFFKRTPASRAMFGIGELFMGAELNYRNYVVFSVMTAKLDRTSREVPVTVGFLGKVYYGKDQ